MSIEKTPARKRRDRERAKRQRLSTAKAGPVTIQYADGTTEVRAAYSADEAQRIVAKKRKDPHPER